MTGTNEVAKVGRTGKENRVIELAHVLDVGLRAKVRPVIFEGYTPEVLVEGKLTPVWTDAHVVPYQRALRAGTKVITEFRVGTHRCNGCGTRGGEWVDINTLYDGIDNALFYCGEGCADEVRKEVHDHLR